VLEIEAADGRNRSHASRARGRASSQDGVGTSSAGRRPPWITALTRPMAKATMKRCARRPSSTPNERRRGSRAKARGQSIRWKASRVVSTSSLHWGGASAALASRTSPKTSSKGGGFGASGGPARVRKAVSRVRSRKRRTRRALSEWCRWRVPVSDKGRQRSAEFSW